MRGEGARLIERYGHVTTSCVVCPLQYLPRQLEKATPKSTKAIKGEIWILPPTQKIAFYYG